MGSEEMEAAEARQIDLRREEALGQGLLSKLLATGMPSSNVVDYLVYKVCSKITRYE